MLPSEFWNCTIRELNVFIQQNFSQYLEKYKLDIQLEELSTDKIIKSNPQIVKNPEFCRIIENYKSLFEIEEETQDEDKMINNLRSYNTKN